MIHSNQDKVQIFPYFAYWVEEHAVYFQMELLEMALNEVLYKITLYSQSFFKPFLTKERLVVMWALYSKVLDTKHTFGNNLTLQHTFYLVGSYFRHSVFPYKVKFKPLKIRSVLIRNGDRVQYTSIVSIVGYFFTSFGSFTFSTEKRLVKP